MSKTNARALVLFLACALAFGAAAVACGGSATPPSTTPGAASGAPSTPSTDVPAAPATTGAPTGGGW